MLSKLKLCNQICKVQVFLPACLNAGLSSSNGVAPNFDNSQQAFKSKSTFELIRACSILALCSKDILVDNALKLMRAGEIFLGKIIFTRLMEKTFYGQFVAGETGPAVVKAAEKLKIQGLNLMVAPALESDLGEGTASGLLDKNLTEYLQLADLTSIGSFNGPTTPACLQMKMTALVPMEVLIQLTNILNDSTGEKKLEIISLLSKCMEDMVSLTTLKGLPKELQEELQSACQRLKLLGSKGKEAKIRIMVDMEWTYVNPACSALALAMMKIYNRITPAICSTVQCYLKGALETLEFERLAASRFGVCYGAKLVRGAYLEKEKQVAPHLVCNSYDDTSKNYERVMMNALKTALQSQRGAHFIFVATHNEAVIKTAINFLRQQCTSKHPNVGFAQIYGMAENISLPLAQANYLVYKSVAFGSLNQVIPYLARRAAENRAIMKGARRERELMMSEIKRRLFYKI
ncbi:proline dehydrogenase 1, mitochondrial-like [Cloeon dipterum]|uniref:proline dehydrogenase 1, mitochondrial-like n=1 Tax=Cloeon dipterum TaxID=197152 RepID=UPI0032205406